MTDTKKDAKDGAERADDRINISAAKDTFFYVDLAKKLLSDADKPNELELTGLGSSITTVVSVADILREQGLATVSKLETGMSGRTNHTAKIQCWVKKTDGFDEIYKKQLEEKAEKLKERISNAKNQAFVFIKPHAVNDKVKSLVKEGLESKGIKITKEGSIKAEQIDKRKYIDQHYYSIASKATILKPKELNVPADKFKEKFGLGWEEALEKGVVYNAMDACKKLEIDADALDSAWAACKKNDKLIKFGGGFYCGLVEIEGKDAIYVFNGFFMSMRSKFTKPGLSIHWYAVEFEPSELSWEDFRSKLLGPTDPATAPADSLRGKVYSDWEALGLSEQPNVGDNGVHASASPFEGLAERSNWLKEKIEKNQFGKLLIGSGMSKKMIQAWCVDPQVKFSADDATKSIFDQLEDLDAPACVNKCVEVAAFNKEE
eukprot:TRINITY_DN201_c0_g1_i2.p1 TRINITY_DN201_c0_g1~~TRINITY_DN201_c0_g1_i2.p1  ORF type:complete len:432 (+),score=157.60 TRINITY_DN201_c0_g1_i2:55-1350(+)